MVEGQQLDPAEISRRWRRLTEVWIPAAPAKTDRNSAEGTESSVKNYGAMDYIGEPVSQLQHSLESAHFAKLRFPEDEEMVLAGLLHDIGHAIGLCARDRGDETIDVGVTFITDDNSNAAIPSTAATTTIPLENMDGCGIMRHEHIGADFCRQLGLPPRTCYLIENHVNAKRYLTSIDPDYHNNLSEASKTTLRHQGGPMGNEEARDWASNPWHKDSILLRKCDEAAKEPHLKPDAEDEADRILGLDAYREMFARHCR